MTYVALQARVANLALLASAVVISLLVAVSAKADVFDVTIANVTTRAFSLVWVSDEPVDDATVRVFDDVTGTVELTGGLVVTLVSEAFPPALQLGIVEVQVSGLTPNTTVFVQSVTEGVSGTVSFPAAGALVEVQTQTQTTRSNALAQPITNDLIQHDIFQPSDGTTPAAGTLMLLAVPGASHPLSAFVGDGFGASAAVANLNNVHAADTRVSAEVTDGDVLDISEFRGLLCSVAEHKLVRQRRAPEHQEIPPITELESPAACFFANTVCDDAIDIRDVQRLLNIFGRTLGECRFNPDMDIVIDGAIDIRDVQSVLNRFGEERPFLP